jgi:eukaryotic-like serine/threonine-protein kinase
VSDGPWKDQVIDGRYVVEGELGAGGMGVVLRAHHRFTGAQVAIKMLHPQFAVEPSLQDRFLAEARAPNQIGHPGIAQVLDAGRAPSGELYIVMELLLGRPLRTAIRQGLHPNETPRIMRELLDALGAAHARGFVHRDLKPENVFLAEPNRTVKLLDFGIAKLAWPDKGHARTVAGQVMGTLAYMAPEQLVDASSVDPRADLWAVGVMTYELISGRLPYPTDSQEALYKALARDEPTPIQAFVRDPGPELVAFFQRALARDPRARFGSAGELAAAIAALPLARNASASAGFAPTAPPTAPGVAAVSAVTMASGVAVHPMGTPAPVSPQQTAPGPAPRRRNLGLPIALGAIALVATIVAVVFATRGSGTPASPSATDTAELATPSKPTGPIDNNAGDAIPGPVSARAPAPDVTATVTKPATPAPSRPKKTAPSDVKSVAPANGPYAASPALSMPDLVCSNQCAQLARCNVPITNCAERCASTPVFHSCLAQAHSCIDVASCALRGLCQPSGSQTCSATIGCYNVCGTNTTCICDCTRGASPAVGPLVLNRDACILACGTNNQICINQRCGPLTAACMRQ